jgi:hypothetical protein
LSNSLDISVSLAKRVNHKLPAEDVFQTEPQVR